MSEKIWRIDDRRIVWTVKEGQNHLDDIEMSGLLTDLIVEYGVKEDGGLHIKQHCFFPTLRTIPNNTHATYSVTFNRDCMPQIMYNGTPIEEKPWEFIIDGILTVKSRTNAGVDIKREFFPSTDKKLCLERITLESKKDITLTLPRPRCFVYCYGRGTKGVYITRVHHNGNNEIKLKAKKSYSFTIFLSCHIANEAFSLPNPQKELEKRRSRVEMLCDNSLVLESNIPELDTLTRFSKLRAGESIFSTLSGKFHSPGGRAYYAAIWCNDQIEYAGPHFAMTGDKTAIEASYNAYLAYIPFMSESYHPLPSSIIAEGLDIWEGAGDRGDAAMYLYGASLFCLYLGDEKIAKKLFPPIKWCAEYCNRKKTKDGVISSDSDELEGRFPTDGVANLSTSSLCYGGLILAARLALSLGDEETATEYNQRASELKNAIESYFGATLHGFDTYRYSKGFDTLRAWICLPLCMGITDRAEGTIAAMLSPYLMTEDGLLSCELSDQNQSKTIWDRATLYGMKCGFMCNMGDIMTPTLIDYCNKRLLCDRVPYPVEAYPEGGKRHLSGESALFVRIITEGIFAISPESLTSFSFDPNIPRSFGNISLSKIFICGHSFDIHIKGLHWQVNKDGQLYKMGTANGSRVIVD